MSTPRSKKFDKHPLFCRFVKYPLQALPVYLSWGLFKILPVKMASALGGKIGQLVGLFMRYRNQIALYNMSVAFPEKTLEEKKEILKKMWNHWGRFYAEMPHARDLFKTIEWVGLEHLKDLAHQNKGGFACSAHIGNWEPAVSGPVFDDFYMSAVYRQANNPWIDKLMFQRRAGTLIPKGREAGQKLVHALHHKECIVMLCDQKLNEGISVSFFGKPAMTAPAIATIAIKLKLPIVMARCIRQPDGHIKTEISNLDKLPEKATDEAVLETMTRINHIFEGWIRDNPEQWLWIHRRYPKSDYPKK